MISIINSHIWIIYVFSVLMFLLIISMTSYFSSMKDKNITINNNEEINYNTNKCRIEYSRELLKFIRDFSGEVVLIKFHEFKDKVDFTKVNEEKIKSLINDIAATINKSLNWDNINIEDSLLNKEFYETYIINTTIIITKELTEKVIKEFN